MGALYSKASSYRSSLQLPSKRKKKPEMEFRLCFILSLCLMANGLPKKTKTGAEAQREAEDPDAFDKTSLVAADFQVRLMNHGIVDGRSGLLQVRMNGQWGTVCDDYYDWTTGTLDSRGQPNNNVAIGVCRMQGSSGGVIIPPAQTEQLFGKFEADPILLHYLLCQGDEVYISECGMSWFGKYNNCHHGEDIGIQCDRHLI